VVGAGGDGYGLHASSQADRCQEITDLERTQTAVFVVALAKLPKPVVAPALHAAPFQQSAGVEGAS
jgi:hypothetical protein